jgi:hypothetical protein
MVFEPKFVTNGAVLAGAPFILRNTEHAFAGNAVEQFIVMRCAEVVRGA